MAHKIAALVLAAAGVAVAGVVASTSAAATEVTPTAGTTSIALANQVAAPTGAPGSVSTVFDSGEVVVPASMVVGVSWSATSASGWRVLLSVREGGSWRPAESVGVQPAGAGRVASQPLVARSATAVRVQLRSASGRVPSDVRLAAIAPGSGSRDAAPRMVGLAQVNSPTIITRAQWGADESRVTAPASVAPTLRAAVIHHTAGWSTYSEAEAYQFIRALYEWYTTPAAQGGAGRSDIIYNYLVDRFGRIFEGRAGGLTSPVVGDHTVGFNRETVGIAVMGDFEVNPLPAQTADEVAASVARVVAWKLAPYDRDPQGTATLTALASRASSRYATGQTATVPVVSPASTFEVTSSPGVHVRERLGQIRTIAASLIPGLPKPSPSFVGLAARSATYRAPAGTELSVSTTRPMAWVMTIRSVCQSAPVRVIQGEQKYPGPLDVAWDLRDRLGVPVVPGAYRVRVTGSAVDGGEQAQARAATVRVAAPEGTAAGPCPSVTRTTGSTAADLSVALGRWSAPDAASAILVPAGTDGDRAHQLIAAPLARSLKLPVLAVSANVVSPSVLADLAARGARSVILVGDTGRLAVTDQLSDAGISSTRISGSNLAATAAEVARALGAPGARGAVFINPISLPAESALAAAAAARKGIPVLVLGPRSVPAATSAVVKELGITAGAAVVPPFLASDALVASLGATRFWGADYTALALQLAPASGGERAVLVPVRSRAEAALAASAGRPVLPIAAAGLAPSVTAWLDAHREVTEVAAAVGAAAVSDIRLGEVAQQLAARGDGGFTLSGIGHRGASLAVPSTTTDPVTAAIASSFTVDGSGWGHGVGLSQAGAYGQAKEGRRAEQIVAHYYTDTQVTGVTDTSIIRVALLHRVPSASLRTEPMGGSGTGAVRVALEYGPTVLGTSQDTFGFQFVSGRVAVTVTRGGTTRLVGTASAVRVTWAGTRTAGTLGRAPTLVNLVGPGDSFSDLQHRYRYGAMVIRPITASTSSPAGLMVLNHVRVHDEYLYGIAEVNASWPIEALRAQIIASRSYALATVQAGLRSGCLCHSDDGGGPYYDQTFLGWVKVDEGTYSDEWRAAVDSTAVSPTTGLAALYDGRPILAFYTDSTGGRTRNVEDVWGGEALPWARGVDDHWSLDPANSRSFARWRPRVRTQAQVAELFGLASVVSVTVTKRQSSGTALELRATSSTGQTATVTGRQFGRAMELPSLWVWSVTPNP